MHKWRLSPQGGMTYVAEGREVASVEGGGMPGSFCAMGTDKWKPGTSVLWCSLPYGDANARITNGRLLAYDPETLGPDGHLAVLWDSQAVVIPYVFNKFMPPTSFKDEVILPNYAGGCDVFAQ